MNEKIRWGIMGTGTMACDFARGLAVLPDAELVAVASRTETRAADFASAFRVPQQFSSYRQLAESNDIDVIHIATPNHRHTEDCLMCLETGKPVLCEKPFTIKASDARRIVSVAREKKLFCMEAMWMRFMPLIQRLKMEIDNGLIGEPRLMVANFGYPVPGSNENRFFNPELGGGGLLDRGLYPISLACFLFGLPDQVSGQCAKASTGVDTSGSVSLSWNNGSLASLHYSMLDRTSNTAKVYGTEGQVTVTAPFFRPHRMVVSRGSSNVVEHDAIAAAARSSGLKGRAVGKLKSMIRRTKWRMESMTPPRLAKRGQSWTNFSKGNGYQYEAAEVHRCLREGLLESPSMMLDDSIAITELMEGLLARWGTKKYSVTSRQCPGKSALTPSVNRPSS